MEQPNNLVKRLVLSEESLQKKDSRKGKGKGYDADKDKHHDNDNDNHVDDANTVDRNNATQRKNRIITQTKKWATMQQHISQHDQLRLLNDISNDVKSPECVYMLQEIHRKINGYKSQDIEKQLYAPDKFVDTDSVIGLLLRSQLQCFYCKENMHVIYAEVRNPKQWSIERIDNEYGHNKDNVEIACLQCNLRRKTMYHERFLFTKQLGNIVKIG